MAEFHIKSKQLLKFFPELQCHKCKDIPGPYGTKKYRYYCIEESHALCERHKVKCPCGSLVGKKPSPTVTKLLQELPLMCQNYEDGCREIKKDGEDLEHHKQKCIFRQVFCPHWACKEKKVMFKDVNDHLATVHKNDFSEGKITFRKTRTISFNFERLDILSNALHNGKATSPDGDVFFDAGYFANNALHYVIYIFGCPDEAKKFSATISISNKDGEKFIYMGRPHTLDKKREDIIASESCFKIGIDVVKRSLDEEKDLNVEYTIRNLKKEDIEDEEESVVSEAE